MVKKLTRSGNSSALILDRTLMDLLEIEPDSEVKVTVEGRKLVIEPLTDEERATRFEKIVQKTGKRNAELFRRLAK